MDLSQFTIADVKGHAEERIAELLRTLEYPENVGLVIPPNPAMGDLGFPCFPLARVARKAPPMIATSLAEQLEGDELIASFSAEGPYVNIRFRPEALAQIVVGEALKKGELFGSGGLQDPQHWMLSLIHI